MIYSYVYYAYAVSVQLTSAKVERILELCKFTLVHLRVFLIFCVIILLYAVEKLQSKGEETVWKGFRILTRELTHPYESVSISLCILRSTPLNVRSTPLNVRSTPLNVRSTPLNVRTEPLNGGSEALNGEMIRMRKQIHCVRIICAYGMKDKFSK